MLLRTFTGQDPPAYSEYNSRQRQNTLIVRVAEAYEGQIVFKIPFSTVRYLVRAT
jgi:hypothetical protein